MTTKSGMNDQASIPQCEPFDRLRLPVGTHVNKVGGYPFAGIVVSAFVNTAGQERFVVEATGAEYCGMLHIFNGGQLRVAEATLAVPAEPVAQLAAAWKANVDATAAYNAALQIIKAGRAQGQFGGNVDTEYRAMSDAKSAFIQTAQDIAAAALVAPPAMPVAEDVVVKLDWETFDHTKRKEPSSWAANTAFGEYTIERKKKFWLQFDCRPIGRFYDSLTIAQQYAQADFERRIRSALIG